MHRVAVIVASLPQQISAKVLEAFAKVDEDVRCRGSDPGGELYRLHDPCPEHGIKSFPSLVVAEWCLGKGLPFPVTGESGHEPAMQPIQRSE